MSLPQRPKPALTDQPRRQTQHRAAAPPLASSKTTQAARSDAPTLKSKGSIGNLLARFRFGSKSNEQDQGNDENGYAQAYAQSYHTGYIDGCDSPTDPAFDARKGKFCAREESIMGRTGTRAGLSIRHTDSNYTLRGAHTPSVASSTSNASKDNANPPSSVSSNTRTGRNTLPRSHATNKLNIQAQESNLDIATASPRLAGSSTANRLKKTSRIVDITKSTSTATIRSKGLSKSATVINLRDEAKVHSRNPNTLPNSPSLFLPLPNNQSITPPRPETQEPSAPTTFELTPLSSLITQSHADIAALRQLHRSQGIAISDATANGSPGRLDFNRVEANLRAFEELYQQYLRYGGGFGGKAEEVCLVALVCKRGDVVRGRVKGLGIEAEIGVEENGEGGLLVGRVERVPDCGL